MFTFSGEKGDQLFIDNASNWAKSYLRRTDVEETHRINFAML